MKHNFLELEKSFNQKDLLRQALTHKSFANENRNQPLDNEKFEFLGDAVLDLVIGEMLFKKFPQDTEGNLSKKRASVVNETLLSEVGLELGLDKLMLLGKGELQTGGALKPRLLASTFEAILGAIFLDQGFDKVKAYIQACFENKLDFAELEDDYEKDYKTRLQEFIQKKVKLTPVYVLLSEEGPAHDRIFKASVNVSDKEVARGEGRSKKSAEQNAAKNALDKLMSIEKES